MTQAEIEKRATQVADLIDGLSLSDASKVIWNAAQMSGAKGNKHHSMISARVVADFVNRFNARACVISLEEDGFAVLRIQKGTSMLNFKIPLL